MSKVLIFRTFTNTARVLVGRMTSSASRGPINLEKLEVHHDPRRSKFLIKLDDTNEAVLEYERKGDIIDMYHTEVPMSYTGKGIAGLLAKTAFDHAVKNNIKMKLSCTYLLNYYTDNMKEEYQKLVVS